MSDKIHFEHRASAAAFALTDSDRARVLREIQTLAGLDPADWPADKVQRLDTPEGIYVLRVSPNLRVLFKPAADRSLAIVDVVLRETLASFAAPAS